MLSLNTCQPKKPYDVWVHNGKPDILHFKYEFDRYMPPGLMSRLIVLLHDYIEDHDYVWRRGMNISFKKTDAEVIESYGAENLFNIRILGPEKIALLAIIRDGFSNILKVFRNLNYKQLVPCICKECSESDSQEYYDYDTLIRFREMKRQIQCPRSFELIDPDSLLGFFRA